MADTPPITSSAPSTPPSSAAEQARIRKERREAKIKAGGSARLNKITGLGGGVQRDPPIQPTSTSTSTHADPDEVDISQHFYQPSTTSRAPLSSFSQSQQPPNLSEDQLRAMMLGFPPPNTNANANASNPFANFDGTGMGPSPPPGFGSGAPGASGDPLQQMLQSLLGGVPGEGPDGMPALPPGMENIFSGLNMNGAQAGGGGLDGGQQQQQGEKYASLWRIIHAVFALSLGLYIAFTTPFHGTKLSRELSSLDASAEAAWHERQIRFFYIFATAEVILQTSRFFVEKGQVRPTGVLGMVMGFLPEWVRAWFQLFMRYSRIWTTVSADAMVCVFVLGVVAWWGGGV